MTGHKFTIVMVALGGLLWPGDSGSAQDARMQLAQANATGFRPMTYADLERLYLDGKISAKQYQKFFNDLKSRAFQPVEPVQPAQRVTPTPVPPTTQPQPPPASATVPPAALPANKGEQINAVESKMDELLKAKAAREKAATNAPPTTVTAGPKTKRDRLNALLRLYIEGKITEPEMNERRAKIIAEPE